MNCFFVSCEVAENPDLKGKKIAVAPNGSDRKGIILAASYEARPYGVKSAMRVSDALRKCPDLIIVEPTMGLYGEYSRKFFEYFLKITPLVEPASIDEGYLDVTDVCEPSEIMNLAYKIQKDLLELYSLPCSIGIAPNKFLAKMASDMKKRLGITVLRKREVPEKLWPLPIGDMIGVGKKTLETLNAIGIKTIGDLANFKDLNLLKEVIGDNNTNGLYAHAHGIGSNEVDVNRFNDVSSISNSQTFDHDEYDIIKMKLLIKLLTNTICNRLEKHSLKAYNFTLQLKYNNFKVTSKSTTLKNPTSDSRKVYKLFEDIFDDFYDTSFPLRLIGVAASKVIEAHDEIKQLSIFDSLEEEQKEVTIDNLIKIINNEVGITALKRGVKEENSLNNVRTDKFDKSKG
jgi:DNA polymerase-4